MTETNTKPTRVEISKKLVLINSARFLPTNMLEIFLLIWFQQHLLKCATLGTNLAFWIQKHNARPLYITEYLHV